MGILFETVFTITSLIHAGVVNSLTLDTLPGWEGVALHEAHIALQVLKRALQACAFLTLD